MKELQVLNQISEWDFVESYVKPNIPVIIKDIDFDVDKWTPTFFKSLMGELPVQVYDTLFSLQEVSTLSNYIDTYFGTNKESDYREKVPYIRWYNKLKNVEYAWGDEAFQRMSQYWKKPSFLPERNLVIPVTSEDRSANPVNDSFPYRGILIAARGARTRLHRDPFCSDAVVSQFYGVKEIVLYHPGRADELLIKERDHSSFGGFIDVRKNGLHTLTAEPDYHGFINTGEIIYIPHGWLHDVLVVDDSISVTWNFIHEKGALEFIDYLMDGPEHDSEFEVLRYFYMLSGQNFNSANEIIKKYNKKFSEIETELA